MLDLGATDALDSDDSSQMSDSIAYSSHADHTALIDEPAWDEEPLPASSLRDRLLIAVVALVVVAWTAAYVLIHLQEIRTGASGSLWLSWIVEWSVPVLLLSVIAQLAIRSSRREQARFADTAALLSRESAELELRLGKVNRELSFARDFIASQSRDLDALGRVASERIGGHADRLQGLIAQNSEQIERIGQVSETAIANLERMRDQLPVLANSARDMTNQIGNIGNVAQGHVETLVAGFERLDQFGASGERHVETVTVRIGESLERFDRQAGELADLAAGHFSSLERRSEHFHALLRQHDDAASAAFSQRADDLTQFIERRNGELAKLEEAACTGMRERVATMVSESDRLLREMVLRRNEASADLHKSVERFEARLADAIDKVARIDEVAMENARARLVSLGEEADRIDATLGETRTAFDDDMQRRREEVEQREAAALAALEQRLATFDRHLVEREAEHLAQIEGLAQRGESLAQRLAQFDEGLAALGAQADETRENIGQSADLLAERLAHSRAILEENAHTVAGLTEAGTRLLEVVRSGAGITGGAFSEAIDRAETRLTAFSSDATALRELLESAEHRGASLAAHIETARTHGSNTLGLLEQLDGQLGDLATKSSSLAVQTRDELQRALDMLTMSTANVLQDLREGQTEAIREIAGSIADQSNSAIAAALTEHTSRTIADLERSAQQAGEAGRATTQQLRDQLAEVDQLTGNLEQRVAAARERAEEHIGDDFARRMALITEALNSGAIDISKAFDNDVSDTQWANYLRGDRGIFTRRAVRLLDKQEARAVYDFYEADGDFRETVNRYIHDFEAMLRGILSTRDGHALAVTLLSSDVGKLYVSLAQAIERLRN
jgi:hypothetical protein